MKYIIHLLLFTFSTGLLAQEAKVYEFTNSELIEKPQPSAEFVKWLEENNKKLGNKALYSSKKETRVTLVFVVDKTGEIQNPMIWRGIGQGYDKYAHQLVKNNPYTWSPGKTKEESVSTQVYYQLDFIKNRNSIRDKLNKPID